MATVGRFDRGVINKFGCGQQASFWLFFRQYRLMLGADAIN